MSAILVGFAVKFGALVRMKPYTPVEFCYRGEKSIKTLDLGYVHHMVSCYDVLIVVVLKVERSVSVQQIIAPVSSQYMQKTHEVFFGKSVIFSIYFKKGKQTYKTCAYGSTRICTSNSWCWYGKNRFGPDILMVSGSFYMTCIRKSSTPTSVE